MKKVIVNALKLNCSKGRIEKGDTVVLSDVEIAKITKIRPDILTVLEDVKPEPKAVAKPAMKTVRKSPHAKVNSFK
tara:strand:+ start:210 stop:437 length:228 start_codon:yes stop_codon:yes gene_type:complete